MKRSFVFAIVAIVLAFTSIAAFAVYVLTAPTPLKIAVGPTGGEDTRLVVAIMQTLSREKQPVRLRLFPTDGPSGSATALTEEKTELAIVRSDGVMPPNAATVAIMHRDVAVVLARPGTNIAKLSDLAGRIVGIPRGMNLNQKLLNFILERSGIDPASVTKIAARYQELPAMMQDERLDAVFVVAPVTSSFLSDVERAMTNAKGESPRIVAIPDAEAIAQRSPVLETFTLLRGTFAGAPPRPAVNVQTLAVTHRLVADRQVREGTIADLAKSLFEVRQAVAADVPAATRIEQPNTEAPGPFVIHPGAAAYFDGEQKSFIEEYGEWIYIVIMAVGLLGSLGAAMMSRSVGSARPTGRSDLDRMLLILRRTRQSETYEALDELEREADESFARMIDRSASSQIEEPVMSAFTIALGEVRAAIQVRRDELYEDEEDEDEEEEDEVEETSRSRA